MKSEELEFSNLSTLLSSQLKKSDNVSRAFLNWFLENVFRLDETAADDAICDGIQDKGIDAIYLDNMNEEIVLFQCKVVENNTKTVGDIKLKEFAGTLKQFASTESIAQLLNGSASVALKKLITDLGIKDKIESGYNIRGYFITNAIADNNAIEYIESHEQIKLYDRNKIPNLYIDFEKDGGVNEEFNLECSAIEPLNFTTMDNSANVWVFPALANNLVEMSGIDDGSLFQQNVRLALGSTKVNRAIKKSIQDKDEHVKFPLYHNGITIICEEAEYKDDNLKIKNYVVVNGAQSITSLYSQRKHITDNLKILTKVIRVNTQDYDLVKRITTNSNNQNAIKPRDLQSNQAIQQRLKTEFESIHDYEFEIKRGENLNPGTVITNEDAGRMILSTDLEEPWNSHKKSNVFEEYYSRIFGRPEVTAKRIVFMHELMSVIEPLLDELKSKKFAYYSATKFFILYIVAMIFKIDETGKDLYRSPDKIIDDESKLNELKNIVRNIIKSSIIVDMNYYLEEENKDFDYKKVFKNSGDSLKFTREIIKSYEKDIQRGKAITIDIEWKKFLIHQSDKAA